MYKGRNWRLLTSCSGFSVSKADSTEPFACASERIAGLRCGAVREPGRTLVEMLSFVSGFTELGNAVNC